MVGGLRHVGVGDPIEIPASTWNLMIDSAIAHQMREPRTGTEAARKEQPVHTVMVRNDTADQLQAGEAIMMGAPLILPAVSLNEFRNRNGFEGLEPKPDHHHGCVVTLKAIPAGEVGLAVSTGIISAQVNITHDSIDRCDAVADSNQLATTMEGAHEIIWKESLGTGVKWCSIRVGRPSNIMAVGEMQDEIEPDTTGSVRIYKNVADTGYVLTDVHLDWMHSDQPISADKKVVVMWFPNEKRWRIIGAECEDEGAPGDTELPVNPDATVDWDVDEKGENVSVDLTDPAGAGALAPGQSITMNPITNAKLNQVLTLTVKQDDEGGHNLIFPKTNYFFPYGNPLMEPYPKAEELISLRTREDAQGQYWTGSVPADLDQDRLYIDPDTIAGLTAVEATIQNTGKGPTISDGANGLDDNPLTYVTLNQDTVVQNAVQEWAVQISFNSPISPYTYAGVGLFGCSYTSANRYPSDVKVYFYSGPNGTGDVMQVKTVDPAVYWPSGVTDEQTVYSLLTPYIGPFQSVEFWFLFYGRNADAGDITFSRAIVSDITGALR